MNQTRRLAAASYMAAALAGSALVEGFSLFHEPTASPIVATSLLIGWVGLCLVAHRLGGIQDKNITLARTTLGRAKDAFWLLALPIYSSMAIGLSLAGVAVSDGSGRKSVAVGCAVAALASMVVTGFRASKVFDTLDSLEQELEQKDAAEKLVA